MFSLVCCSWNDLEYLKILYRGIQKHSKVPYEFIVHDNGSNDGTLEWLRKENIKHSRSEQNLGISSINICVENSSHDIIVQLNADMYPLPGWDLIALRQIKQFRRDKIEKFIISSTLIEPCGYNPEYSIVDCGCNAELFKEEELIHQYSLNHRLWQKKDTIQYSHPIFIPKSLWLEMEGVDEGYEYGVGVDHDIPAAAYRVGCRNFIMLGSSRVYHFISKTIQKLPSNRSDGQERFKEKWGISVDEFRKKMGIAQPYRTVNDGIV